MAKARENFAETVKEVRRHLGVNWKDLAHEQGVSFSAINRWENSRTITFKLFGSAMTKIQKRQANKSYSRSKPLAIAECDLEKAWWGGAERKGRKTTEQAWKVSTKELIARNYNLDCKNPHEVEVNHRDPEELMAEYQQIVHQLEAAQAALKAELMACLGGKA